MRLLFARLVVFALCAVSVFVPATASGQTWYFENYGVQNGLAQSNIYDILQDREGYIWLCTGSGVTRFDGRTFENFTTENGLAENGVRTIMQDEKGNLWFGHNGGGISLFDGKKMRHYLSLGGDVTRIMTDKNGYIWAITATDGAIRITDPFFVDPKQKNALPIAVYDCIKGQEGLSDRVFGMAKDSKGTIYFITDVGIKFYNDAKGSFEFFKPEKLPSYFLPTYMLEDSRGLLWFGTHNGGLYRYNAATDELRTYDKVKDGLAHNFVSTITEDSHGNIWVGTWGGGLTRISPDDKLTTFPASSGLKDNKIRRIVEDQEGNLLIGTNENGLMIWKGEQFVTWTEADGLINEQVWAILETRSGDTWFGTNKGISVYNPADTAHPWTIQLTDKNGLPDNQVRFLKSDPTGNIWIGTWGGGAAMWNVATKKVEFDFNLNYAIQFGTVTALDVDQKGEVWIGTNDGLLHLRPEGLERITQEMDEQGNKTGLLGNDISAVFADHNGNIWVGSRGKGITRFTPSTRTFTAVEFETKVTPSTFYEDQDGHVWVGTEGHGLLHCEGSAVVKQIRQQNGLLSDNIAAINRDRNGQLWIGTNRGLNKLDVETGSIRSYGEKAGFVGIEVKANATMRDKDGNLWFGTVKGATCNYVERERSDTKEPLTHITQLRVNLEPREMTADLSLHYREKNLIFNFTGISLSNPDAVTYQVRLEGLEKDWRAATSQTVANYSSLPPGDYTFFVNSINAQGIANTQPQSFSFSIRPPFWQTWWFYVLCFVTIAGGIIAFVKVRERNLKQEKAHLEQVVEERTAEVVQQKEQLAEKNENIMDSIRYAERIQRAILPVEAKMLTHLTDAFVLFRPKDIVSGDFYWFHTHKGRVWFSAIDCTGHGVPGAFVSLIGNNGLQRAVTEFHLEHPGEILTHLREFVVNVFRQQGASGVKDGMDMSLCSFDPATMKLEYAGANNPLYLVRNGEITIIKADKMPVGDSDINDPFTTHTLDVEKGDCVYLFTDGFADQFGGPKGKKFMYKPFQRMLLEICDQPMAEQKERLDSAIIEWMESGQSHEEQVDDICVMGVRI